MRTIRIFLSSPGDCHQERSATHSVVERLNHDPLIASFARLEVVAWDWGGGVPFDALASPQVSVNQRLRVPEECDVFLGIFRCRFGSPLPTNEFRRDDGIPFQSGSEYEFDRVWKARRRGAAAPDILMYRLDAVETQACAVSEQLDLLNKFFENPPFQDQGHWIGSVNYFLNTPSFETTLDGHLRVLLSQMHPNSNVPLMEWLKQHARRVEHDAGPRYTCEAHIDSDVNQVFEWLLARPKSVHKLDALLSNVWKNLNEPSFAPFKIKLQDVASKFREDPLWLSPIDFEFIAATLEELAEKSWNLEQTLRNGDDPSRTRNLTQLAVEAQEVVGLLREYAPFTQRRVLLLTGPAGQGKTHTLVHEMNRVIASGGIAVGTLGQTLSASGDLRSALLQTWSFTDTFDAFLDALENKAALSGRRALIFIDALNETPNRTRWRHELNGILGDILERPHLTVALSVRSDYRLHVLPVTIKDQPQLWLEFQHTGFSGIEPDAMLTYCAHYGVTAPVAPPLGELSNPLYVQLLVKSLQGRSTPSHWLPSWLEVWEAWIEQIEADARGTLVFDPSRNQPIRRCFNKLANAMIVSGHFHLTRQEADELARSVSGIDGLISFLCSAGALVDRIENDDDIVEFGFERLSDTFFIDRLLARIFEGINEASERRIALIGALSPNGELAALAAPNRVGSPLAHRRSGLLEALCLAAPARVGAELPELIPTESPNSQGWILPDSEFREAFTDSMRWRCRPEEFAGDRESLWQMYRERGAKFEGAENLNELIRLALIPSHPFAMEHLLHPNLMQKKCAGERDAIWSIELVSLWHDNTSNLTVLIRWACESNLLGLHPEIALPVTQVLAWSTTSSQQKLREHATRGLTRVLVACSEVLPDFLPDFLIVNDDYVLECVLAAVWGVMIDGRQPIVCSFAARQVHDVIFGGKAPHCHLTIRHYARKIVEKANEQGLISNIDLTHVRPPYISTLPLAEVPSEVVLRALDTSRGFHSILSSALGRDFYWYVMGGTSGNKPFSSQPLGNSTEPVRSFSDSESEGERATLSRIFDIPLASRFVAWNCLKLGWTAERFNEFDTGYEVRGQSRNERPGRTERIGKKYQWISWQIMLAFLADNYRMTPGTLGSSRLYDSPQQISYIELLDPSRWLQLSARPSTISSLEDFWNIPSLSSWPSSAEELSHWGESRTFDLSVVDVLSYVPNLPSQWGAGPWMRIAAEHSWSSPSKPGMWGLDQELDADIWWQLTPALIKADDLSVLLNSLEDQSVREKLQGIGRIDLEGDWDLQLSEWPNAGGSFGRGIESGEYGEQDAWLPVPWMQLAGKCGHPDRSDEHGPLTLPWPRLFQDWGLSLDLENGVVRQGDSVVFGLAGWVMGEDVLFAQRDALVSLLTNNELSLVWWLRGERRAFVRGLGFGAPEAYVWIDFHGVAYLARDGQIQIAWIAREKRTEKS